MNSLETTNLENMIWQVEVGGQVYEANLEELTQWIAEGALQPQDKVRRGNLRWLEANKIPALYGFFNAKELGLPMPSIAVTVSEPPQIEEAKDIAGEKIKSAAPQNFTANNNPAPTFVNQTQSTAKEISADKIQPQNFSQNTQNFALSSANGCVSHPNEEASFACTGCAKAFCKTCPKSYGGTVKVCPSCGEMCKPVVEVQQKQSRNFQYQQAFEEGFGFADFGRALIYPFKFKFSLISGAILFMFFMLGRNAASMGGFMIAGAMFCLMMANALTFGILANTVENFSQGKTDINFMPGFDDFNMWDDVIHPFFLSIGTYMVSFGPLLVIIAAAAYFAISAVSSAQPKVDLQALKSASSHANPAPANAEQSALTVEQVQAMHDDDAKNFEQLEKQMKQAQMQAQQEAAPGGLSQTTNVFSGLLAYGKFFIIAILAALIWGVVYFPAACAVAGYTRSFTATLNPSVGFDTIKRLGFDYVKILLFCVLIFLMGAVINFFFSAILSPLDLPQMGNLAAKSIGSLFTFYFSIVFSVMLGYSLYKNAARFNFNQS